MSASTFADSVIMAAPADPDPTVPPAAANQHAAQQQPTNQQQAPAQQAQGFNRYAQPEIDLEYLPLRVARQAIMRTRCRHTDWEQHERQRISELEEASNRVEQMDKAMRWWAECTSTWRQKWQAMKQERNSVRSELMQLQQENQKIREQLKNATAQLADARIDSLCRPTSRSNVNTEQATVDLEKREEEIKQALAQTKAAALHDIEDLKQAHLEELAHLTQKHDGIEQDLRAQLNEAIKLLATLQQDAQQLRPTSNFGCDEDKNDDDVNNSHSHNLSDNEILNDSETV